jgi:hypothetical protein
MPPRGTLWPASQRSNRQRYLSAAGRVPHETMSPSKWAAPRGGNSSRRIPPVPPPMSALSWSSRVQRWQSLPPSSRSSKPQREQSNVREKSAHEAQTGTPTGARADLSHDCPASHELGPEKPSYRGHPNLSQSHGKQWAQISSNELEEIEGTRTATGARFQMTIRYGMLGVVLFEAVLLLEAAGSRYFGLSSVR